MARRLGFIVVVLVAATQLLAAQTASSIQGVWQVSDIVTTGDGAAVIKTPQPGFYIFTKQHYSIVTLGGTAARKDFAPPANAAKLTDAEKIARFEAWDVLTANSGTYQTKGNTLTTRPMVAKNPGVMTGPPVTREFKIEGNTLTIVQKSAAGQPVSQTTTRLTRVE